MSVIDKLKDITSFTGQVDTIIFYDPELFSQTFGGNFTESFKKNIKGTTRTLLFGKQMYYKFQINPERLGIRHAKVQSNVLTKNGYEHQYHEEGMITYSYSGKTGYMKSALLAFGINDIRFSQAWAKLEAFKKFYEDSETNIQMYYDGMIHEGFFTDFNFDKDADDPYHIEYNFNYMVYPHQSHALTTAASTPVLQAGLDVTQVIKSARVTIL